MTSEEKSTLLADVERHDKAMTPGEWHQQNRFVTFTSKVDGEQVVIGMVRDAPYGKENVAGIAFLRNNAPALAALVREQDAEILRLRAAVNRTIVFIEYARYELAAGKATIGDQFPKQDDATAMIESLKAAIAPQPPVEKST